MRLLPLVLLVLLLGCGQAGTPPETPAATASQEVDPEARLQELGIELPTPPVPQVVPIAAHGPIFCGPRAVTLGW